MTTDEWKRKKMSDVPQSATHAATDTHGTHRTRSTWGGNWKTVSVYLTDAKRIDPPTKQAPLTPAEPTAADTLATMAQDLKAQNPVPTPHTLRQHDERIPSHDELHEMKQTAAQGVVIVAVQQLFPTPPELADRMVALADIRPGQQVLEPSAGTGRIIDAIRRNAHGCTITAVELNCNMAHRLRTVDCVDDTRQADFLECNGDLGTFDRIVMNPPFANGDDIKHIMHALKMLKSGGRLVAICANGPRQNDKLRPIVEARSGFLGRVAHRYFHRRRYKCSHRPPHAGRITKVLPASGVTRRNAAPEAGARGQTPSVFPLDLFSRKIIRARRNFSRLRSLTYLPRVAASFPGWVRHQTSMNSDKQTATHADGLLMTARKAVVVGGFEKPAKAVLTGRPEHEVAGHLTGY
jgi:phospholipid N-methyltransferase